MRIETFQAELKGDIRRATANVVWEDSAREPISVYFETDSRFCGDLEGIQSAYLLAAGIPAFFQGERRLRIDGTLDPVLCEGVATALAILQDWNGFIREPLSIEPSSGFEALRPAPANAALFLTGGVDSLHLLRTNRQHYSPDHPASFRAAISIAGLAFPTAEDSPRSRDVTARQEAAVRRICELENLEMISVASNLRWIEPDVLFTTRTALGACLAAAAHFVSGTISSASIASGVFLGRLTPNGSHPLLDPNYSSAALEIRHEGAGRQRLEKVAAIARWETALENLFVCFEGPLAEGQRNCGSCEKCLRTMAALLCVDGPDRPRAFPPRDLTAEMLRRVDLGYHPDDFEYHWGPIAAALRRSGRGDLARAVRKKVAAARRFPQWRAEKGVRGAFRRLDRTLLRGSIARIRHGFQ